MTFAQREMKVGETIGELLTRARLSREYSQQQLADETHIHIRYIQSLEAGRYSDLPGSVYVRKYVHEICRVLDTDFARLEKQLKRETALTQPKEIHLSPKSSSKPLWIPSLFRWGIVGIIVLVIGTYFAFQVVKLIDPPALEVTQPAQDIVWPESVIVVKGRTLPGAQVSINGQAANVDQQGVFEEQVALRPGLNRLEIVAKTKYSAEATLVRQIVVQQTENPK